MKANLARAEALIASRTTDELVFMFRSLENEHAAHIPTVRGWIMDELEKREPAKFTAWMEDTTGAKISVFFLV